MNNVTSRFPLSAAALLCLILAALPTSLHAQSQGDACSVAGKVYSIDTPGVPALHCESGTLQNFFIPKENAAMSCTAVREGALQYIAATDTWNFCNGSAWTALASGGGGTPAGSNGQIQFNNSGAFGADANFVFTSAGRVGIGTAAPASQLEVDAASATTIPLILKLAASQTANSLEIQNSLGVSAFHIGSGGIVYPHTDIRFYSISVPSIYNQQTGAGTGLRIGGSQAVDSYLALESSRSGGGTGDHIKFLVGTNAATEAMRIISSGNVGIGTASPTYMLSLEGDTANRTIGMERETTAATAGRALTLLSGGAVSGGTNLAGGDLTLSGGTATGTGTSKILFSGAGYGSSGTADRAPAEVGRISGGGYMQFTGTFGSGDTMAQGGGSATPGGGTRMVWYPRKGAFRAGRVSTTEWDDANIGNYSFAAGFGTIASGVNSFAVGGNSNTASNTYSAAIGSNNTASGNTSFAVGQTNTANGQYGTAIGTNLVASGINSIAMGRNVFAGSGTAADGSGDGSMALGLMDNLVTISTPPQVRGIGSLGIFMGDQEAIVQTGNDTLALYGGKMVIDSAVPATYMAAPTYNLSFSGDTAAQTIGMERETTAATAGRNLTISSGGAVSGGTDLAGGNLVLQSGIATGNGASSILFQTVHSGQGTGTTDRSPATSMTLDSIRLVISPPASEAVAGAAVITADACGTIKQITSVGNVTTNTTDTFTSPTASYAGCCMDVVNVDTADTITLDANAKFKTIGGADQALGPDDTVRVCSNGTNWYQVGAVAGNQ